MADQLTPRGSALLSGTRRRLVKAGAAVAWTVPVMHTLTAQQAFAAVTGRFDVQLTDTIGSPCDDRADVAYFCYQCTDAKVVYYKPGSYFVQAIFCNGPAPCSSLTATLAAPLGSDFDNPFVFSGPQAVHVCRNRGTGQQSDTSSASSSSVTISNVAANECLVIEWHLDTSPNIPCPSPMPSSKIYAFTVSISGCGNISGSDSVTAYLKGTSNPQC
jgi:hypothetical protein